MRENKREGETEKRDRMAKRRQAQMRKAAAIVGTGKEFRSTEQLRVLLLNGVSSFKARGLARNLLCFPAKFLKKGRLHLSSGLNQFNVNDFSRIF